MKSIGIVICNYNKCSYVLNCIQSVLESKIKDFDIYVVDNASTDNSVNKINEIYNNKVNLIINNENLGGSGGFNTGIRKVIEKNYKYIMCLDNDVQVDENAVGELYNFLEQHKDVGMVGSKVYHLQAPAYIQQFGLNIDFEHFCAKTLYADVLDNDNIPEVVYCDTVAACSVMLPVKVVKEVGIMPEDNFIYWDDMEWGYKIKLSGYKVAAYGKSEVLHEMGANIRKTTTFTNYYLWRNSINFFMKYTKKEDLEKMSLVILRSVFDAIYESIYRQEHNIAKTIIFAYHDAVSHIRGKAGEGKILPNDGNTSSLSNLLKDKKTFWIENITNNFLNNIASLNNNIKFIDDNTKADIIFKQCKYIMEVNDFSLNEIYIDEQMNILANQADIQIIKNYNFSLELFLYMNQELFINSCINS